MKIQEISAKVQCPKCGQELIWVGFCGPGYEDGPRLTCGCPRQGRYGVVE